jgi:hypothetical protein
VQVRRVELYFMDQQVYASQEGGAVFHRIADMEF